MKAYETDLTADEGLSIYDLAPQAGDLVAVAGPAGYADPDSIDEDDLPDGFRCIEGDEWERAAIRKERDG